MSREKENAGREPSGNPGAVAKQRWISWALPAVLAIVVVGLVFWNQRPRLKVTCTPGEHALQAQNNEEQNSLEDQVILTGPEQGIIETLDRMMAEGIQLAPIRVCNVNYRAPRDVRSELSPFPPRSLRSLSMGLYQIEEEQSLAHVLTKTQEIGLQHSVYADANYLVGLLGQSSCGNPYEVVGSPYEVVGSPYEVVGSPYEVVGSPYEVVGSPNDLPLTAEGAAEIFWNQWAFRHIGVGPHLTHTLTLAPLDARGSGVRVGVLDALPFAEPAQVNDLDVGEIFQSPAPATVQWWTEMGTETELEFPLFYLRLPDLTPPQPDKAADIRDHGLFVAGLIQAIAPESQIHLYRVLNEYGCSRVFAINEAILHFVNNASAERPKLDGAVINLSLGVHKPRTPLQPTAPSNASDSEQPVGLETPGTASDEKLLELLAKDTIESLRTAIAVAHGERIVVVAAAGNDSYLASDNGRVLSPHIPALYPSVIGVAASDAMRERSCFSNWGDVSAPGGGGGPNPELAEAFEELDDLECAPMIDKCFGDCKDAVISVMTHAHKGYGYWIGTSFSTPLVSGLAALVIDAQTSGPNCGPRRVSPDQVFNAIRCGASTADGIINVPATLYRCLP